MNEVTRIHLGRQPFTIAVDAHTALRAYLADISEAVGSASADVSKEVELRMAELLTSRGITSEKVVLVDDVAFLKQQLGDPKDFKEEDDDEQLADSKSSTHATKRLFRDTENGMLAGVAAGLSNYFGIDATIVRIIFIITILTGGWGILLYIALWLLVPEAKTSSERLQMYGKAVTVDSLKEVVERADVHGAAQRAGGVVVPWVNSVFRLILKVIGFAIILGALSALFGLISIGVYMALHNGQLFQEGYFPVGTTEHILAILVVAWAALVSLFLLLIGMAMVRRKWPIASWATGVIVGLLFIGLAVGIALGGDTVPKIRDRFEAAHHSISRTVPPFTALDVKGDVPVDFIESSSYAVTMRYVGNPNVAAIKTSVVNKTLELDSSQFKDRTDCTMLCLFRDYDMHITVYTPFPPSVPTPVLPMKPYNVDVFPSMAPLPPRYSSTRSYL